MPGNEVKNDKKVQKFAVFANFEFSSICAVNDDDDDGIRLSHFSLLSLLSTADFSYFCCAAVL